MWYPAGRVLSLLMGYGILTFIVIYLTMASRDTGLVGELEITLGQIFATVAPHLSQTRLPRGADPDF